MVSSPATNISSLAVSLEKITGLFTLEMFQLLIQVVAIVGLPIAAFGTAGNIINIIVYTKMGFTESTNISLIALACSDLGVVLTSFITEIFFLLPFIDKNVSVTPEASFTIVAVPHLVLTRTSALITAFLSLERFLCVFSPLKIKQIITSKRTTIIMLLIFAAVLLPMINVYFRYPVGWWFFPDQNRSLLTILPVYDKTVQTSYFIFQAYSSTILPIFTFVLITFCTILLVVNLRRSKKWRESNRGNKKQTSTTKNSEPSNTEASKENKAIKLVVAIATVFIISNIPSCIHVVAVMMFPEFDINGRYQDIFHVTGHTFFVFDSLNCSANLIIYYNMSTKFRHAAQDLFRSKLPRCFKAT